MSKTNQVIKQWLETDAAFGVVEVPLPRPRKIAAAARAQVPAAIPVSQARQEVAQAFQQPKPGAPVVRVPTPGLQSRDDSPQFAVRRASAPKAKAIIVMPSPPAGDIGELPPLTRKQKEQLLEQLLTRTAEECAGLINEISTKLVFGEGDPDAAIMFIGEGPGIEEDRTGRPFVGRSGQLLDKMIAAMGYKREVGGGGSGGVYIANVVKLRCADPDGSNGGRLKDRPPTPEEAARGLPVLHRQIEIIRPKVIVTLGAPAVRYVTGTTEGVMKIRGTWLVHRGIPVMPTYHPSFLLRAYTEENRRKVWGDLQMAMKKARG